MSTGSLLKSRQNTKYTRDSSHPIRLRLTVKYNLNSVSTGRQGRRFPDKAVQLLELLLNCCCFLHNAIGACQFSSI